MEITPSKEDTLAKLQTISVLPYRPNLSKNKKVQNSFEFYSSSHIHITLGESSDLAPRLKIEHKVSLEMETIKAIFPPFPLFIQLKFSGSTFKMNSLRVFIGKNEVPSLKNDRICTTYIMQYTIDSI